MKKIEIVNEVLSNCMINSKKEKIEEIVANIKKEYLVKILKEYRKDIKNWRFYCALLLCYNS